VRDISPTGMFIVTEERWYWCPSGTVIRVTLTDRHNPTRDDYNHVPCNGNGLCGGEAMASASSLSWRHESPQELECRAHGAGNGMDPEEIEEFLRVYKS